MVVSVFKNHYLILQFFNENDEDIVLNNSDVFFITYKELFIQTIFSTANRNLKHVLLRIHFSEVRKPMIYPWFNDNLQFTLSKKTQKIPISKVI